MDEKSNFDNIEESKSAQEPVSAEQTAKGTEADVSNPAEKAEPCAAENKAESAAPPPPPRQNGSFGTGAPPRIPQNPYGAPRTAGAYPPPQYPYGTPYNPYATMTYGQYMASQPKKKKRTWLIVLLSVIGFLMFVAFVAAIIISGSETGNASGVPSLDEPYVAVIYIDGEIAGDYKYTQTYGSYGAYNQVFLIDTINGLALDENNAGIMLYIDSPGGEIIATDELRRTIESYKETTGRPVYAYFHATAASGAYWIGATADKIIANKYCTTGSIGVTYGVHLDISELLKKLGITATTIASGENKGMGSMYEPMTDEQKAIFKEQIDEMYETFVSHVAVNRGLSVAEVKAIADGRTMLASKALECGLVDAIGYFEDAKAEMIADCGFGSDMVFYDCVNPNISSSLSLYSLIEAEENEGLTEQEALSALIKEIEESRRFMVKFE